MPKLKKMLFTMAALGALALGGSALAGAASNPSKSKAGTAATADRSGQSDETALTGDTADKVKAAALAKVDGTVVRVETDRDGVYEAHIRKADGTEVEVRVDKDFKVTATEQRGRGDRGGHGHRHGGRRGGPGAGETALTGDTADKVKAAALAKVDGTVVRVETDRDGVYEAHIRKADGTEVEVRVDKDFKVTEVQDQRHP
jgi:uncharacterized membrane protein YkoI